MGMNKLGTMAAIFCGIVFVSIANAGDEAGLPASERVSGPDCRYLLSPEERDRELETSTPDIQWMKRSNNIWRMWYAQMLFQQGRTKDAQDVIWGAINGLKMSHKNFFCLYSVLNCYLACSDKMDDKLKDRIKQLFVDNEIGKRNPLYRGSTSNLGMLANVNCHLVLQTWGTNSFSPAVAREMTPKDLDRSKMLIERLNRIAIQGSGEFASRPYGAWNLLPLMALARYSTNDLLRARSMMVFEATLAHAAGTWLRGHWAVPSGRSYPDSMSQIPNTNIGYLWYYFGGLTSSNSRRCDTSIVAKMAGLKLSPIIVQAASDRSKPYVARSRFDGGNRFQYTYMNKRYAMFSNADSGKHAVFGQCYPYGVMWDEPDPAKLGYMWITAPRNDGNPLPDHAHGVGKYGEYLQYEDTLLIAVNDLDNPANRYPYVLCRLPGGYKAVIDESKSDGRVFIHYHNVMIAVNSTSKFSWDPNGALGSGPGLPGESEFRIKGNKMAVAVETALPEEYSGDTEEKQLKAFRDDIAARSKIRYSVKSPPPAVGLVPDAEIGMRNKQPRWPHDDLTAFYTDRHGVVMEKKFVGNEKNEAKINGVMVDYESWPLIDNPWVHQDWNSPILTITDGKKVRKYDFLNWKVTETDKDPPLKKVGTE